MNVCDDASVLVLNCGSSSIKAALFAQDALRAPQRPHWRCDLQGVGSAAATLSVDGLPAQAVDTDTAHPYGAAFLHVRAALARARVGTIAFAVHRVVHGGERFHAPVRIDDAVLSQLAGYVALAPLHQPFALELIQTLRHEDPALVQYACFDTAFHHTLPTVETMLPLPAALRKPGLRRYGFHGLSYDYLARVLGERYGAQARGRLLAAHLGSGASLCAIRDLRSVATTMGFSPLDGLMMGTRCGALDAGALLHLAHTHTPEALSDALYHAAGLLGVSERSADPRVLLQHEDDPRARDALALYLHRMLREIGALVAVLGGLDMFVFTAGIGEHNATIRARVCAALGFLGVEIDAEANLRHAAVISTPASAVLVLVEPTNEEWVAAADALACHRA